MGEVWRGVNRAEGLPVAVKVIGASQAREPAGIRAFRDEVRATAALDHANIVLVREHGQIDSVAERASGGTLVAGSPYLAMELASGGSLRQHGLPRSWMSVRQTVLYVLDALAHAHARGVVHRDIKLGNLLVCEDGDLRPGLKVTDFGIASAMDEEPVHASAGTLLYMAPEQVRGETRDQGPWTDLYAVGVLCWALVSGDFPFKGSPHVLAAAHLTARPPRLIPRFDVPEGLDEWLACLMAKAPRDRFAFSADAARALVELGDSRGGSTAVLAAALPPREDESTLLDGETTELEIPLELIDPPTLGSSYDVPEDWHERVALLPPPALIGAGLGLFGLRQPAICGRQREQGLLWSALRSVRQDHRPSMVLVRGPGGVGKSRLAKWLVECAHERGAARWLYAVNAKTDGPTDALQRLLCRQFRTFKLPSADARARVIQQAERDGASASLASALADLAAGIGVARIQERCTVFGRYLELLSHERAVVVWLDDVQWGADSLGLCQRLLAGAGSVLILATARDDLVVDAKELGERASVLDLGTLDHTTIEGIVRRAGCLDAELSATLASRSGGNPLLALQLLATSLDSLVPGPRGFTLAPGADPQTSMQAVWRARVGQLLAPLPPTAQECLELAAVLGPEVDEAEWRVASASLSGPGVRGALLEALLRQRLAVRAEFGWTFAHSPLRECLEGLASEGGRLADHHRRCAELLTGRLAEPGVPERLGRHLLAAGEADAAIEHLMRGAEQRSLVVGYRSALALVASARDAAEAAGLPPDDRRRGKIDLFWASLHRCMGHRAEAGRWRDLVLARALEHDWRIVEAGVHLQEGEQALSDHDPVAVHAAVDRVEVRGVPDDSALVGGLLHLRGHAFSLQGDLERAHAAWRAARVRFAEIGDRNKVGHILRAMSSEPLQTGDYDRAEALYLQALPLFEEVANRFGVAGCQTGLGECARGRGDLTEAARLYRLALSIYEAIGSPVVFVVHINLALLALQRGDPASARLAFSALEGPAEERGAHYLAVVVAGALAAEAMLGEKDAADRCSQRLERLLGSDGDAVCDADVELAVRLAASAFQAAGHAGRAQKARLWGDAQARALGRGPS